jgi:hydrogenase maturation factor
MMNKNGLLNGIMNIRRWRLLKMKGNSLLVHAGFMMPKISENAKRVCRFCE